MLMKREQVLSDPEYYIEPRLKNDLIEIRKGLQKKDKDYVMVIDGLEGTGKSTHGIQIGKFVDSTLTLDRVTFTAEDFKMAILGATVGQCVIYDEAFTGLSSRGALSEMNRMLVSLMMQMRQKNLFVIIILPSYFLLDKYVALFRAKSLIHVYEIRGIRGYFAAYNVRLKRLLYLKGLKTYDYSQVITNFRGRFYGKFALGPDEEAKYVERKSQAFIDMEYNTKESKPAELKRKIVAFWYDEGLNVQEITDTMTKRMAIDISERHVRRYVAEKRGK